MSTKLYVGNLSFRASEDTLRDLFAQAGQVESVKIITDRDTGQSRGFGFVEMATGEEANKAISMFNGTQWLERELRVAEARPQQKREGGGGRRGRGGPGWR